MVVRELLTRLGFEVDSKGADKYESQLDGLIEKAKHLAEAWGLIELGKKLTEAASDEQQLQVQFESLTGSTEKAQEALEALTNFSLQNPIFDKDELAGYAKQMLSLGYAQEEIMPLMTQMGNISAVVGKDKMGLMVQSLTRIRATGKVSMREVTGLMRAGVPIIDQMAKGYGVTKLQMASMLKTGQVGADQYYKALTALTTGQGKFANGLERQKETYKSLFGGLVNRGKELMEVVGFALLPSLENIFKKVTAFYDKNKGTIEALFITPLHTVLYILGFLWGIITGLINAFGGWNAILKVFAGIWDSFWKGLQLLVQNKTFDTIAVSLGIITAAWWLWNAAMDANPLGLIVTALGAIIAAFGYLSTSMDDFAVKVRKVFTDIKQGMDDWFSGKTLSKWLGIDFPETAAPTAPTSGKAHAAGTTYVDRTGPAFLHQGEAVVPRGQLGSLLRQGAGRSMAGGASLTVNATVQVAVPSGTPTDQQRFLQVAAEKAVKTVWDRVLRQTQANLIPAVR